MRIFKSLERKRKIQFLRKSQEYPFYLQNRELLNVIPHYDSSLVLVDDFDLIKSNIVIQSMMNKAQIEKILDDITINFKKLQDPVTRKKIIAFVNERIVNLPFLEEEGKKIYFPLFSRTLNMLFLEEPEKLLEYPYSVLRHDFATTLIDPFEAYGYALYNSKFTNLIKISGDKTSCAFYHFDYRTIYIINDQGRLDIAIPLFDKAMKKISTHHLIERITKVVEAFYTNNRETFIHELYAQKFVSFKLYRKFLKKKDHRLHRELFKLGKKTKDDEV